MNPKVIDLLTQVINENYQEEEDQEGGVDEILDYELRGKGGSSFFIALGRKDNKYLAIKIDGEEVALKLVNPSMVNPDVALSEHGLLPVRLSSAALVFGEGDSVDAIEERAIAIARPDLKGLADQISSLMQESTSLAEFSEYLDRAFPDLETGDLAEVFAEAMIAARLTGTVEAGEE